jgi:acetyl esterase/lipase
MPDPLPLWHGAAPGARGNDPRDIPAIFLYPAASGTHPTPAPAMLVLPGGGYGGLAPHEGEGYAHWLTNHGIHAYVLRYRLGSDGYRHPTMLQDAARALRTLRANAGAWGIDAGKIGVMGSSAGGHLAATLLTQWTAGDSSHADPVERVSSRPDLGVLCYPVITMTDPHTHAGSRANLLGEKPSEAEIATMSAEKCVNAQTPPTFLWHTAEDPVVPVENALLFATALAAHKVPFALHAYERGRHGLGLGHHAWGPQLMRWLSLRWPVREDG